ncbi:hypothetical protein QT397_19315 [Microbulbifer sp. MKSA007]|nr:hypothetical protein QT397_19315 [Microbulbifer sp. MKSA007]
MKAVKISVISLLALLATACGNERAPEDRGTMVSIAARGRQVRFLISQKFLLEW